jgi:plasmid stabilization system protein ParE
VRDRPSAADAVIGRILKSAERLGQFPYMGHTGAAPGTYEWVIPGLPYIIVYQVLKNEDVVSIDAVFHGAQERERGDE